MVLETEWVKALVRTVMQELRASARTEPQTTLPKSEAAPVEEALQAALSQPELQRALLAQVIQVAQSDKKLRKALADEALQLDILQRLHPNAAGLGIGAAEIWACVPFVPFWPANATRIGWHSSVITAAPKAKTRSPKR